MPALVEDGRAKVNLTLRVVGRRVDGYHDIESVVAFADCADRLSLLPGAKLTLTTTGPLAQDEIFGPVLAVLKSRDLSDALRIANGTRYALTGGLFSRSPENIARVKREFRDASMKIGRPVFERVAASGADYYSSDCPMAGHQIESGLSSPRTPTHPLKLLRMAYGI